MSVSRYDRQMAVASFGPQAQKALAATRLLVVGAGGLAAPLLQYLAGAGIGLIRLVDPDHVSESNLHRQTLFGVSDLGKAKAEVAARRLVDLNPDCRIEPVVAALDPDMLPALAGDVDILVDCADSFAVSYMMSDHGLAAGMPLVSASVVGEDGYSGAFCGGMPSLRAVFPDLPQRMGSCAEQGVLGPVVGVIGSLQAQMVLALAGRLMPSPLGRIVSFDAARYRFGGFSFAGAEEPAFRPAFIAASAIRPDDLVIDLRAENEAPLVTSQAIRATVDSVAEHLRPASRAVLVCRSGLRAWHAADRLSSLTDMPLALVAMGDPSTISQRTSR